jgi:hypothetical protein
LKENGPARAIQELERYESESRAARRGQPRENFVGKSDGNLHGSPTQLPE